MSIATKSSKGVDGENIGGYAKFKGYVYQNGSLYWKFNIYSKSNKFLGGIHIKDSTGGVTLV